MATGSLPQAHSAHRSSADQPPRTRRQRLARRRRALFEKLEDRQLLATFVWDGGGGANNHWMTPANWAGDVAPTGTATDDLVFTGSAGTNNVNNFPVGATFNSIRFDSSGGAGNFVVQGNPLTLNGGIDVEAGAGTQTLNTPLFINGASTINVTAGSLTLGGALSGTGSLAKTGAGTLNFGSSVGLANVSAAAGTISFHGAPAGTGAYTITRTDPSGPIGNPVPTTNGVYSNIALASFGSAPFASAEAFNPPHSISNLNDGLYGNSDSWIGNVNGGLAGIDLQGTTVYSVSSVTFGRDNDNVPPDYVDRSNGQYTLYRTLVPNPTHALAIGSDPSTGWVEMGKVTVANDPIRKTYAIAQGGAPVNMTGMMIRVSPGDIAIDEIEIYGAPSVAPVAPSLTVSASATVNLPASSASLAAVNITGAGSTVNLAGTPAAGSGGFVISQTGSGPLGNPVPASNGTFANLALATAGAIPFASDVITPFAAHSIPNLNDGLYGNGESWIGSFATSTFAGVDLPSSAAYNVSSIAFGRSNTGDFADRSDGTYTLYRTLVANPNSTLPITGDPATGWASMGTVTVAGNAIRKTYSIAQGGVPVAMTGLMMGVPTNGAIDEIEIYGELASPGPINLPATNVTIAASATLNLSLASADHRLGTLSLTGGAGTTALNLQGAANATFTSVAATGAAATSASISGAPVLQIASGGTVNVAAGVGLTINSVIGGSTTVHKAGTGTLLLANTANTYTGETIFDDGIVNVASVSNYGVPSSIGARTAAMENASVTGIGLHFQGGTLQYTGATPQSTNRQIRVLNGATGSTIDASGTSPSATLSFTHSGGNINLFDTEGARTINLVGTNTGANTFAIQITNQSANQTSLRKAGSGTWLVTNNANTYTGETILEGGILNVSSLADYGVASAIGARTLAEENGTPNGISLHFRGGTLQYTGATPQSTNRQIRVLNGATGSTIDASGSNPGATLSFTHAAANINLFDTGGTRTINLVGTNSGPNLFAIPITNQSINATSLRKAGTGTWVVSNNNSYSGGTTVAGGVLRIANTTGSATGAGAVVVESGARLEGEGAISGAVTVQNGGTISPGMGGDDTGTLATGSLDLQAGSTAKSDIDGALFDQVRVNGNITIADGQVIPAGEIVSPPVLSAYYVIANNLGTNPVGGALATLPQNPAGTPFVFDGLNAVIYYNYNADTNQLFTGNDIAIAFNRLPSAVADTPGLVSVSEDAGATNISGMVGLAGSGVLGNDTDPDGNPLTVTAINPTGITKGVLSLSGGVLTYNPSGAFESLGAGFVDTTQSFQYTVTDSNGGTATGTATIMVVGQNDAVVAGNDPAGGLPNAAYTTNENTPLNVGPSGVLANDADVDARDTLAISSFSALSNQGAAVTVNADGSFSYNPAGSATLQALPASATATDTFTYTLASQPAVGAPAISQQGSTGAFTVFNFDLLHGLVPAVSGTALSGQEGTSNNPAVLTNGTFGTAGLPEGDANAFGQTLTIGNNTTLTYSLDTAASPLGYDITQIDSYSGWRDNGRDNQNYIVRYATVANPGVFVELTPVGFAPVPAPSGKASITSNTGVLLRGVSQIQFVFTTQENNFVGYRELDVLGAPTTAASTATGTVSVAVIGVNDAPVLSAPASAAITVNEGQVATNSGAYSDVDAGDIVSITASVGTVTKTGTNSGGWNWSLAATDGNTGPITVTITATDAANSTTTTTFTYTINNVAPTLAISGAATADEGMAYTLNLLSTDPGADTISSWAIDWGDGSGVQTVTGDPASVTHVYGNGPANWTISATATDEDGTYSAGNTVNVTVNNLAPQPAEDEVLVNGASADTSEGFITVVPGVAVTFVVSASDPAFHTTATAVDGPFTFEIDFGDGSDPVTGTTTLEGEPIEFTHVYDSFGDFQPTVTVTDRPQGGAELTSLPLELTRVVSTNQIVIDGTLYVAGGGGSDRIIVSAGSGLRVRMNNVLLPRLPGSERVIVYGNAGDDTITISGSPSLPVEFYGGEGDDYLAGGTNQDTLDGGPGRDRLLGGAGSDTLLGGDGNDTLSGGLGSDYLSGDEFIDVLGGAELEDGSFSAPGDVLFGSEPGNDTLNGDGGSDTLLGGGRRDTLSGGTGADQLHAGDGDDRVDGGDGADLVIGDGGNDILYGRAGRDVLIGGDGLDVVYGSTGADLVFGGDIDRSVLDADALTAILLQWTLNESTLAIGDLEMGAVEDDAADTLHGESDSDWYLTHDEDRFKLGSERRQPNTLREL